MESWHGKDTDDNPRRTWVGLIRRVDRNISNPDFKNLAVVLDIKNPQDNGNPVIVLFWKSMFDKFQDTFFVGKTFEFRNVEEKYSGFYKHLVYNFRANSNADQVKSSSIKSSLSNPVPKPQSADQLLEQEEIAVNEPFAGTDSAMKTLESNIHTPKSITIKVAMSKNYQSISAELVIELGPDLSLDQLFSQTYDGLYREIKPRIDKLADEMR